MRSLANYYERYWDYCVKANYLYRWPSGERARIAVDYLNRRLPTGAKVLDLGCGEGHFGVKALSARVAWNLSGIDISNKALAYAARFYDATYAVDVEDDAWPAEIEGGKFNAIVCLEALEHLFAPVEVISRLDGILAPDGVIIGSFPNFSFWRNRVRAIKGEFPDDHVFGVTDHLHYFTPATFKKLFIGRGFAPTYVGGLFEYPRFTRRILTRLIPKLGAGRWAPLFAYQIIYAFRRNFRR